jgi:hypothetical protein
LAAGEQLRLETLAEHVCRPNDEPSLKPSFYCPDTDCQANKLGVVWDEYGDYYGAMQRDIPCIDGLPEAFGSFARQAAIEICKHDEDYKLCTIPCFPLKGWTVRVKYIYKGNENGEIIQRRRRLEWITPDNTIHIWGLRMLLFCCKKIWKAWRELRRNPSSQWARNELSDKIKWEKWANNEWWRKCCVVLAKIAIKHSQKELE